MADAIPAVTSISATIDQAPFRPIHVWLFLAATGGTLLDGVSVFMTGLAVPFLRAQFAMGPPEVGLLGSAVVMGAVVGAVPGGLCPIGSAARTSSSPTWRCSRSRRLSWCWRRRS